MCSGQLGLFEDMGLGVRPKFGDSSVGTYVLCIIKNKMAVQIFTEVL